MRNEPRFDHVIFDLDGTLLNTIEDLAQAANHVCEINGWPTFATDRYRYKVGNGVLKLVERFMPAEYAGDSRVFAMALSQFRAFYDEHKEDHTAPYAGIRETLDALLDAGVTLAVLTNKDHAAAGPLVARYFGHDRFALVQGHVNGYEPKPAAPITRHVLEQLRADPARTLYVGDSDVDVQTGHNAGLSVAGAAWGFRGEAELVAEGAEHIAHAPVDLIEIVLGGRGSAPAHQAPHAQKRGALRSGTRPRQ